MNAASALQLALLALVSASCTSFPSIPDSECGNGVLEKTTEDCDTFAPDANSRCRPKGSLGECHLDCTPRDGMPTSCPPGWGCDSDAICREPSGGFGSPTPALDVGAWSLVAGDFDGDGQEDVMSSEPLGSIGSTRVKFFYFDRQGVVADTRSFPTLLLSPTVKKLPGDELSDVTFSVGPLGVMHGRADRTWVPETFTSYRVEGVTVRVTAVYDQRVEGAAPFVPLFSYGAGPNSPAGSGFFVIDSASGRLGERAHLLGSIADLAGDPVSANVLEDPQTSPCFEPVYAFRGQSHFTIVNLCQADPDPTIRDRWKRAFEQTDIELEPPAAIDAAPQYADLDNDGHLDVLVGAAGKLYVAYGDGQSLGVALPFRLSLANVEDISADIPMPLAAGDFTADGAPDFVFPDHLLISAKARPDSVPIYSDQYRNRLGALATSAKIADFNGDGRLDVVTASSGSLNLDLYTGHGGLGLSATLISTAAPVQALSVGDFDGDRLTDLALLEEPRNDEHKNTVKISYGRLFAPLAMPVSVAEVFQASQIEAFNDGGVSGLTISSADEVDGQSNGALTILNGSADRAPFAPFDLTEFTSNGAVQDSQAIAVAVGRFTARGRGDVIALAVDPLSPQGASRLWVLPDVEARGAYPRLLKDELDAHLMPTSSLNREVEFTVDVTSASADLDGDGRDEAIFAMPAAPDRKRCGVLTLSVAAVVEDFVLDAHEPVLLDEPCHDPSLVPVDADGDGFIDLALLTGQATADDRKLYVLWNDRSGGFSSLNRTLVSSPDDSPQAFSVLPAGAEGPPRFVYVNRDSLRVVPASVTAREFLSPETPFDGLHGCTGIAAADVNGDRVTDLVIARSGFLQVLKAELKVELNPP